MAETPIVFGQKAVKQIEDGLRDVRNRLMNPRGHRGRWQFHGGSGAVCTSVRFEIVSSDPTTLKGLATILAWDYGFTQQQIPATILDATVIEICDPKGCFLNEPNTELTGRQGTANYRQGLAEDVCRTGYPPYDGVWEVETLCCRILSCEIII